MQVNIIEAACQDKSILHALMQYYLYEFSEIAALKTDESGQFQYPYLNHYWSEDDRYPYLIIVDGDLAGFTLLRRGTYFPWQIENNSCGMLVAEIFVMRGYRRLGVGTLAALDSFARFPGRWEVAQEDNNHSGQSFWRTVIGDYCGGEYDEYLLENDRWRGPVQVFNNYPVPR